MIDVVKGEVRANVLLLLTVELKHSLQLFSNQLLVLLPLELRRRPKFIAHAHLIELLFQCPLLFPLTKFRSLGPYSLLFIFFFFLDLWLLLYPVNLIFFFLLDCRFLLYWGIGFIWLFFVVTDSEHIIVLDAVLEELNRYISVKSFNVWFVFLYEALSVSDKAAS